MNQRQFETYIVDRDQSLFGKPANHPSGLAEHEHILVLC